MFNSQLHNKKENSIPQGNKYEITHVKSVKYKIEATSKDELFEKLKAFINDYVKKYGNDKVTDDLHTITNLKNSYGKIIKWFAEGSISYQVENSMEEQKKWHNYKNEEIR